jgi:subtilisin family serine protease
MQHAPSHQESTGYPLTVRRPAHSIRLPSRAARSLLLVATITLLSLIAAPRPAPAAVLSVVEDSDILLVQPAANVTLDSLALALATLGYTVVDGGERAGVVRVAVGDSDHPLALADAIAATGLARGVEADTFVHTARIPTSELIVKQLPYLDVIRAPEAWDHVTGDGTTVIAIVDSGLDYNHPDFRSRLLINGNDRFADGIDNDRNGCIDDIAGCNFVSPQSADASCNYTRSAPNWAAWDDDGHGTVVAGIAAAAGDDGTGIVGLSWDALLLPVKVLDCTGVGRISIAAAGLRYAAANGAHIINISFGTTSDSNVLHEAVLDAQARGVLIVSSAGNVPGIVTFPGAYPGVIAVGASGYVDPISPRTNRTREPDYKRITTFSGSGPNLDLIAPGYLVAAPLPAALCATPAWACDGGPYTLSSGSSFAAAIVTGAAALIRAQHPDLSGPLLSSMLLQSLQPASNGGVAVLDVAAALEYQLYRVNVPGTAVTSDAASVGPGG